MQGGWNCLRPKLLLQRYLGDDGGNDTEANDWFRAYDSRVYSISRRTLNGSGDTLQGFC